MAGWFLCWNCTPFCFGMEDYWTSTKAVTQSDVGRTPMAELDYFLHSLKEMLHYDCFLRVVSHGEEYVFYWGHKRKYFVQAV